MFVFLLYFFFPLKSMLCLRLKPQWTLDFLFLYFSLLITLVLDHKGFYFRSTVFMFNPFGCLCQATIIEGEQI